MPELPEVETSRRGISPYLVGARIDPLGNKEEFRYNSEGLLGVHMNALGEITSIDYDAHGYPIKLTDAAGNEYMEPSEVKLMILPEGGTSSRLAWAVVLGEAVSGWNVKYRVFVDAATGEPLMREKLTYFMGPDPANAKGLVFEQHPEVGPQLE